MTYTVVLDTPTIRRAVVGRGDMRTIISMFQDWFEEEDIYDFVRGIDQNIIKTPAGSHPSGRQMVSVKSELVAFRYTFENRIDAIKFALRWK